LCRLTPANDDRLPVTSCRQPAYDHRTLLIVAAYNHDMMLGFDLRVGRVSQSV